LRIFFLSDGLFLAGGQFVNLEHVLALRRTGHDARFWFLRKPEQMEGFKVRFPPGLEAPWQFEPPELTADDVVVVGEMHGLAARALSGSPARKIVHNQGFYLTFQAFIDMKAFRDWGCEAMICPSDYAAGRLRRMGWDRALHVVRPGLDPVFAPDPSIPRKLQIAAVTTKRLPELRLIRGILRSFRPDLADLAWVGITRRPRAEVADWMKRSEIFLALGEREGLGLPPLEAMWAGALVVGFHAGGGQAYATAENGDWFDDDRHVEIAETLISLIDRLKAGKRFEARRAAGVATAETFSRANFEAQLAQAWAAILGGGR
jgi:glycosyltransferase involved in cell wall biosynthesis